MPAVCSICYHTFKFKYGLGEQKVGINKYEKIIIIIKRTKAHLMGKLDFNDFYF